MSTAGKTAPHKTIKRIRRDPGARLAVFVFRLFMIANIILGICFISIIILAFIYR